MTVDLERLRGSLARYAHAEESSVPVAVGDLEALVAVVDAAWEYVGLTRHGEVPWPAEYVRMACALEPFTPPADRAWEEVDRWHAERDLAVKAAVDAAKGNPRDRARDQLADAGVAVQRQFRSDQERIAELEAEVEAGRTSTAAAAVVSAARELVWAWNEQRPARMDALVASVRRLDMSESRWVGSKP